MSSFSFQKIFKTLDPDPKPAKGFEDAKYILFIAGAAVLFQQKITKHFGPFLCRIHLSIIPPSLSDD